LKTSDNSTFATTDKELINVCEHCYKDLYSSNSNISEEPDFFFPHENPKTLDSDQQSLCEGKLTKAECLEALKSMDSDKSPGSDGLPADFYKVFWNSISDLLLKAFNYAYENRQQQHLRFICMTIKHYSIAKA